MTGVFLGNALSTNVVSLPVTPVSVAANTTAEQSFTVAGLVAGDYVGVSKPSLNAGLGIVNARVSAANTLAVTYSNNTASPIVPTAETYTVLVVRSSSPGSVTIYS